MKPFVVAVSDCCPFSLERRVWQNESLPVFPRLRGPAVQSREGTGPALSVIGLNKVFAPPPPQTEKEGFSNGSQTGIWCPLGDPQHTEDW